MKKREITIPTLIGILIVVGGLLSGLWLVQRQISSSGQAAAEIIPKEVVVANIVDSSFTVTWVTDKAVSGYVQYGKFEDSPDMVVSDDRDQQKGSVNSYFTHFVTVRGLKPDTRYKFKISSGGKSFDQDGKAYEVRTGMMIGETPTADVAYGQVVTANGEPADGALVYLTIQNGGIQAALAKPSGSWVIPLSTIRTTDLASFITYNKLSEKMVIEVNDGPMGKSRILTTAGQDSPVSQIVLGQNRDYSAASVNQPTIPTGDERSKLGQIPTPGANERDLIILTPQSGEGVNSSKPQIIGVAPANSEVTVEIHSDVVISGKVTSDSEGNFTYSVPQDLPPGEHLVTISTTINGVLQKVTRTFTVYAAGENFDPAYSATPSANLTPRVSPTKIPTPTATIRPTIRPTIIPTPSATPRVSAIPTVSATPKPTATIIPSISPTLNPSPTPTAQSSLPASGETDLTTLLLICGVGLLISGWWWYRKAV